MQIEHTFLIDNDRTTNFLNQYLLLKYGSFGRIHKFNSCMEVVSYLEKYHANFQQNLSVLFLEIHMPSMDGWELLINLKRLRLKYALNVKVIILSTTAETWFYRRRLQFEFIVAWVKKPLSQEKLNTILNRQRLLRLKS
ncbi:response regulator [Aquimarina sp. W85]|uniref:response regulator n=1 Tax=Aquimarina rhodophyticola TaxID=3342246 RepID=UPI00366DB71A